MTDQLLPGSSSIVVSWFGVHLYVREPSTPDSQLMQTPFPWNKCSVRVCNCFRWNDSPKIEAIGDMIRFGKNAAFELRNFGEVSAIEIRNVLEPYGLADAWERTGRIKK